MINNEFIFSSESVTEGHPDKVADQISDSILDEIILNDKKTVKTVFFQKSFPTRRFYSGNPWFVPLLIKWYGFKDLIKYGRSY